MLILYIKAAAECSAGFQHPKRFSVGCLFVRESVKAVQGQNDVEGIVCIGECSHIALLKGYVIQLQPVRLFLLLPHHIR